MGMFDTFVIPCLFCKSDVEEQTKSGPCTLATYKWNDPNLPVWLMEDFNNLEMECYECHRRFVVRFDFEVIVKGQKLEPVNNLDLLELELQKREEAEGLE